MNRVSCIYMRGGTSKGPFLDLRELPNDVQERNNALLRIMGSPDTKQIDGIGGASFVTSKVVMVQPSEREGIDVDYLFAQVFIDEALVDTLPTCGNMMSGVGPYAIEKAWVKVTGDKTSVQVYNINTDSTAEMIVHTHDHGVKYAGDFSIDGVPGSGAAILMRMQGIEGGATGKLFPTGSRKDLIQGKQVTLFDAGNIMVHMKASDFGLTGMESGDYFLDKPQLMNQLESIRLEVADRAGMGDVSNSVLPKIGLLSKPRKGGNIRSLYFTPKTLHPTHAVSGAVCVTSSALCEGTIAYEVADTEGWSEQLILEHQAGIIPVELSVQSDQDNFIINSAGTYRTARKLMDGHVYF